MVPLWHDIYSWYDEGGPDNIADNLKAHLKDAEKEVSQNIKTIPAVKSHKKSRKRRK